jgi:hypothetical protein
MPATIAADPRSLIALDLESSRATEFAGAADLKDIAVGSTIKPSLRSALATLASAAATAAHTARADASGLNDSALLENQRLLAATARQVELVAAALAAEVAHRSRRELGYAGLAQRHGVRTAETLVQTVTGSSAPTARRLVRAGSLISSLAASHDDPATALTEPWLAPLISAVAASDVSTEALDIVRNALGTPSETVPADALQSAVAKLTTLAPHVTLESLAARAREFRDDLDSAGVAARESERRARRSLRLYQLVDGTTRLVALLDPESAAVITSAIDAATALRRGGPRFIDRAAADAAQHVIDDPRTTEQLALDALVELVDVALRSRSPRTPAARRADVRVLVTQHDLDRREGTAHLDGQTASVSIATAERHACDGGLIPILFDDDGTALNLGRSQRLHSSRQRIAIAVRDGGCLAPGCDRPPSWCEVHHIQEFSRGGRTDLNDGILLCRHHHMLVHNNGWRVVRRDGRYWMLPPPGLHPPNAHPAEPHTPSTHLPDSAILLATKSAAVRRMLADA